MAQVLIIEPDELAVTAFKKIFAGDDEIKLKFIENFLQAEEILNGNPQNKDVYEKHQRNYEEAQKEFHQAEDDELKAKTTSDNAADLVEKYEKQLETLRKPDADAKKEIQSDAEKEAQSLQKTQIETIEKEIENLNVAMKGHKDALQAATKLKGEKEKIATEKIKIAEEAKARIPAAAEQIYNVLMVSNKLMLPTVALWLENFKTKITFEPNKEIKIIVLGFEYDEKSVKKYLVPRVSDYMIKPVDELLAKQNIKFLALTGKKAKREVYSLQVKEPVDLIFEYELEAISEVSFSIKSKEMFEINDFKVFESELFLRKNQRSVLAKCLNSKEQSGGGYLSEFWFVGMDTNLAFQIKNVIKNPPKI